MNDADSEISSIEELKENLEHQLAEIEILQSMYPGDKEFILSDPWVLQNRREFVAAKADQLVSTLEFVIALDTDGVRVESLVTYPLDYPLSTPPEIYVRFQEISF